MMGLHLSQDQVYSLMFHFIELGAVAEVEAMVELGLDLAWVHPESHMNYLQLAVNRMQWEIVDYILSTNTVDINR